MEVSGPFHDTSCSTQGNEAMVSTNRKLAGPWSHTGCIGKEKNLLPLLEFKPWFVQPLKCSNHSTQIFNQIFHYILLFCIDE